MSLVYIDQWEQVSLNSTRHQTVAILYGRNERDYCFKNPKYLSKQLG